MSALALAAENTQLKRELSTARSRIAELEAAATRAKARQTDPATSSAAKVKAPAWGTHRANVAHIFARCREPQNVDGIVHLARVWDIDIGRCPWKRVGELARLGWIEEVGVAPGESGVDRITYRMTETGGAGIRAAMEAHDG